MKKKIVKLVFSTFLFINIFFLYSKDVNAKIITIEEFKDAYNSSEFVEAFRSYGITINAQINSEKNTFDVYGDEGKLIVSFEYGDDYIALNNRDEEITEENIEKNVGDMIILSSVLDILMTLSGHEGKTISKDDEYLNKYDIYGIEAETEEYYYSGTDEGTWTVSGDFIKYFKISLDTDKLDKLIEDYGVDKETTDNTENVINIKPTLEVKNITENSITLNTDLLDFMNGTEEKIYCDIYRSTSEDGTYEKITSESIECSTDFTDKDLESNKTYYYKALVANSDNYSDILKITTSAPATTTKEETIENPKTGMFTSITIVSMLLLISIIAFIYTRKYKKL